MTGDARNVSAEVASELLALARASIRASFDGDPLPRPRRHDPALEAPGGAFVTLKGPDGTLRGCIGCVESPGPLWETVAMMARAAAFDDPRFPALEQPELDDVTIEVSVMSPLSRVSDPDGVVAGVHGVVVERGSRRGLLLPQVATEYGWDRKRLLDQVCLKAGLPPDSWHDDATALYVFTASVVGE
jgi:AmmeMemoRadiSam system protein A